MRVSDAQYEVLGDLAKQVGMKRVELLNNAIALVKFLVDQDAETVKAKCKDGSEKELFLTLFFGNKG